MRTRAAPSLDCYCHVCGSTLPCASGRFSARGIAAELYDGAHVNYYTLCLGLPPVRGQGSRWGPSATPPPNEMHGRSSSFALNRAGADYQRWLERAWAKHRPAVVLPGSIAETIEKAAAPWSPRMHKHFPAAERRRAMWLMMLCARLEGGALRDVWIAEVLPRVLHRLGDGHEIGPAWLKGFEPLGLGLSS